MMMYTWWCWHICKGEIIGVELDQLGEEKKVFRCTVNYGMVLGLEFYIDPLCFGSNMQVGCVALWVNFSKCPKSLKSEFGAKRYSRFNNKRLVTGRWTRRESGQHLRVWSVFL